MQNVPYKLEIQYRKLMRLRRKSSFLIAELVLHPDFDMESPVSRKQIKVLRRTTAELDRRAAECEKKIWENYANGRRLVREQRELLKSS